MTSARKALLRIETPEGVVFSFRLATPAARALAWSLDSAIIMAASSAAGKVVAIFGVLSADVAAALSALLYFLISIAYGVVLEWYWRGQTVGKRLFRLRVADAQGLRLQFTQVLFRNLLRAIDMLPLAYLVGGAAALLSRHAQRLGDVAANTVVLREPALIDPNVEQIAPAKYNSLLAFPHLAARLRQRVNVEAVAIAVAALTRRDGFEPLARIQLFGELAEYFRSLVEFPAAATEGLTDEQYIRSAVRAIYRGQFSNASRARSSRI
jgi:uncharacterized RDD family membrane protein YckC